MLWTPSDPTTGLWAAEAAELWNRGSSDEEGVCSVEVAVANVRRIWREAGVRLEVLALVARCKADEDEEAEADEAKRGVDDDNTRRDTVDVRRAMRGASGRALRAAASGFMATTSVVLCVQDESVCAGYNL